MSSVVPLEPLTIGEVAQHIFVIRGQRVLLDTDLAHFYGESTKRLNQQVNRNRTRFPDDFMFQLTPEEFANLRLQSATVKSGRGQWLSCSPSPLRRQSAPSDSSTPMTRRPRHGARLDGL